MQHAKYPLASPALRDFIHYTDTVLSDALSLARHLKDPDVPDDVREDIERIADNALRVARIVSYASGIMCSLEDEKLLVRKEFDVYDSADDAFQCWGSRENYGSLVFVEDGGLRKKYINFSHNGRPYWKDCFQQYHEHIMGLGDPSITAGIFSALFSNAAKYGRSRAELGIEQQDGFVVCSVRNDVETQIPSEYREAIFNTGVRVPGTGQSGTGLGLASARRLAELQGGKIWLETEGDEVNFRFTIPASNK